MAFFRLVRATAWWLIALKGSVFMQLATARINHSFGVRYFFVVGLTGTSLTQIADAFRPSVGNEHVLVTVRFLFAAIVQRLFFRVFRALAAAFCAINNVIARATLAFFMLGKLLRVSFGQHSQVVQSLLENRQKAMNPIIGTRLAQVKEFAQ